MSLLVRFFSIHLVIYVRNNMMCLQLCWHVHSQLLLLNCCYMC